MDQLEIFILANYACKQGDRFKGNIFNFPEQSKSLSALVKNLPVNAKILEIGFNAGHSSTLFLDSHPTVNVTSFDLGVGQCVNIGKKYIDMVYPDRHKLILGDSNKTIPLFTSSDKYDLIFTRRN